MIFLRKDQINQRFGGQKKRRPFRETYCIYIKKKKCATQNIDVWEYSSCLRES